MRRIKTNYSLDLLKRHRCERQRFCVAKSCPCPLFKKNEPNPYHPRRPWKPAGALGVLESVRYSDSGVTWYIFPASVTTAAAMGALEEWGVDTEGYWPPPSAYDCTGRKHWYSCEPHRSAAHLIIKQRWGLDV